MRVRSAIQRTTNTGDQVGLFLTERDLSLIAHTARWWSTTADTLIRLMHDPHEWRRWFVDQEDLEGLERARLSVTRRLRKLTQIIDGAPLETASVERGRAAYWCTLTGGDLVSAPWERYPKVNVNRAWHAWAASDVGSAIERAFPELTVCSEREFAVGVRMKPLQIVDLGRNTSARPDLAVLNASHTQYIAGEVERKQRRPAHEYRRKLEAYYADDEVSAVWYFVSSRGTAMNIKRLVEELRPLNREMPVRVIRMIPNGMGFHDVSKGLMSQENTRDVRCLVGQGSDFND